MPIDSEKCVSIYLFHDGRYEKVSEIPQVEINMDDTDERELCKIRDRRALTMTVSLDDESMRWLKQLVARGIRRKKKHLIWKRGRRYLRIWRRVER